MSDFTALDLSKTRTKLLLKQPFFGSLAMRLKYVPDSGIGTLCTNGSEIRYSPAFMGALNEAERQGVIVHELSHCFMLHIFRRDGRDMETWNRACDFAVNPMIEQAGFTLPREVKDASGKVIFTGPCLDKKYVGMSAEAIYAKLKQEKQKEQEQKNGSQGQSDPSGKKDKQSSESGADDSGSGAEDGKTGSESGNDSADGKGGGEQQGSGGGGEESGSGSGDDSGGTEQGNGSGDKESPESGGTGNRSGRTDDGHSAGNSGASSVTGDFVDGKADAEGALPGDMNEQDWKIATEQAIAVSRAAGKLPGGWVEEIQATRVPKMDPWAILDQFVDHEVQSDYSWTTPNRRLIASGHYMPGVFKENVGEIVIGLDTSGSASSEMLSEWASHISAIAKKYTPSKVHVVMCDTKVTEVRTYEPSEYDDIDFHCKGRGGTEFQPVFTWVEEQEIDPVCLLYFTDGFGPAPVEPDYPVLWAIPAYLPEQRGPFGETVYISTEE